MPGSDIGAGKLIEVYRGCFNSWECDENDHVNVRFYTERFMNGLAVLSHIIGMPHAFQANPVSRLQPRDLHVMYLAEIYPAVSLTLTAGILEVSDCSAVVYMELKTEGDEINAAMRCYIDHVDGITRKPFEWPKRILDQLSKLQILPEDARAGRSLDQSNAPASKDELRNIDSTPMFQAGLTIVQTTECGINGFLRPDIFMGYISDAAPHVFTPHAKALQAQLEQDGADVKVGNVVVESRFIYRKWPRAGDVVAIRASARQAAPKTRIVTYWLVDPVAGDIWATAEIVSLQFDKNTRKAIAWPDEILAHFSKRLPPGLKI